MLKHTIKLDNNGNSELPKYAEVHLCYICPECESQIWIRASEAKIHRKLECIGCGNHLKITPLRDVGVTYSMEAKVIRRKLPLHVQKAVKLVMAAGYSKPEAVGHVKSVPNYKQIKDVNLLVRQTLESIKPSQS